MTPVGEGENSVGEKEAVFTFDIAKVLKVLKIQNEDVEGDCLSINRT